MSKRQDVEVTTHKKLARSQSFQDDLIIPLFKSFINGALVVTTLMLLSMKVAGLPFDALLWAVAVLALATLWYLFRESRFAESTLWAVEERTGKDWNEDGVIGQPESVIVLQVGGERAMFRNLLTAPEVEAFSRLALAGKANERAMTDMYGMERPQWQDLRDGLVGLGWMVRNHPTNERLGWSLTRRGADQMRRIKASDYVMLSGIT